MGAFSPQAHAGVWVPFSQAHARLYSHCFVEQCRGSIGMKLPLAQKLKTIIAVNETFCSFILFALGLAFVHIFGAGNFYLFCTGAVGHLFVRFKPGQA